VWRAQDRIAIAAEVVGALLIGDEEQEIGMPGHVLPFRICSRTPVLSTLPTARLGSDS
jgi:hypothetical protein